MNAFNKEKKERKRRWSRIAMNNMASRGEDGYKNIFVVVIFWGLEILTV